MNFDSEKENFMWQWTIKYFERIKKHHKLHDWTIKKDRAKRRLGLCNHTKKVISISKYVLGDPKCSFKKIKNTILHEIAHALTPGHKHDEIWRRKALEIGCDGKICGSMVNLNPKYLMKCPNGCFIKEYHRKVNINRKICKKCRYQVIFVSN